MLHISQDWKRLRPSLDGSLATGKIVEKDFNLMHVNRKEVKDNMMPLLMFYMDKADLSKSLRFNFVGEGAHDAGILDYGGGKKDFFQMGIKALFEKGTVFTKSED